MEMNKNNLIRTVMKKIKKDCDKACSVRSKSTLDMTAREGHSVKTWLSLSFEF